MQYFVVMIDYGKSYIGKKGPSGYEALPVNPEYTRRAIVEQVADILGSDDCELVHVKHIDGNFCEDVTDNIKSAIASHLVPIFPDAGDHQAARFDHAHDLRKHEVV